MRKLRVACLPEKTLAEPSAARAGEAANRPARTAPVWSSSRREVFSADMVMLETATRSARRGSVAPGAKADDAPAKATTATARDFNISSKISRKRSHG